MMKAKDILMLTTRAIPDKLYLQLVYHHHVGKWINFKSPKGCNEKLQWLKLYDRRPEYIMMVDKVLVKDYVGGIIGQKHIIPTLGVWDTPEEIDFDSLPDQFVLKCNHDSGSIVICKDKSTFDREAAIRKLSRGLKRNAYWYGRAWPYKNVRRKVFAEKYMVDESGYELKDYKFFCFDGKVKYLFIATDRTVSGTETKFDFFDENFVHLPVISGHENAKRPLQCPKSFDEMKRYAAMLSKGYPQMRVDFYDVNGDVYFGEITFFHWSGFKPFEPEEWDNVFGQWIELPDKQKH